MDNNINKNSLLVASKNLVATGLNSDTAESVVILTLQDGIYYELKGVAVRVWELLQSPQSLQTILDIILSEYEVNAEQCESDLLSSIADLIRRNLVEFVNNN